MSYKDFANNKNPKVDYKRYLDNFDEPIDSYTNDSRATPSYKSLESREAMKKDFRRTARKLRGAY